MEYYYRKLSNYGLLWFIIVYYGFLWFIMVFYGFLWFFIFKIYNNIYITIYIMKIYITIFIYNNIYITIFI